jgi:large subunit ribosomal protein L9
MEIILKEDVENLGHRGDVVKVAQGYGRNFLLPRNLGIEATPDNKAIVEQVRVSSVRRSAKEKTDAELLLQQFENVELKFTRKTGDNDHLFGSVTGPDIAQALEAKGFQVDRRKVQLEEPLKSLGEFLVPVRLHREVTAHVKVVVAKEADAE